MFDYFFIIAVWAIILTFFSIPVAASVFFVASLILFIIGCVKRNRDPESFTKKQFNKRLILFISSSVTFICVNGAIYAILILFLNEIAYM